VLRSRPIMSVSVCSVAITKRRLTAPRDSMPVGVAGLRLDFGALAYGDNRQGGHCVVS
jgi:hypothetical protein